MKKIIRNNNNSKKYGGVPYIRKSRRRILANARAKKAHGVLAEFQPLFRNIKFCFLDPPASPSSFLRAFCMRFLFTRKLMERLIPSMFCSHLYISSSLIYSMLTEDNILTRMHGYYYTSEKRFAGELAENFYESTNPQASHPKVRKSNILPFIVATPDFFECQIDPNNQEERIITEVKHSCEKKKLNKIIEGQMKSPHIQLKVSMSVFGCTSGRLVLIHQINNPRKNFRIFETIYYSNADDYIEENFELLARTYFQKVITSYFSTEFSIKECHLDYGVEEEWFFDRCKTWKESQDAEKPHRYSNRILAVKNHWQRTCIGKHKKDYTRILG